MGVLVDDLVGRGTNEPYRMLSARAEFRLRQAVQAPAAALPQLGVALDPPCRLLLLPGN